ncbi:type II secretion system protein GspM [Enterobacter chuandaensis]|uniref:Type II secretion system protein GspM n=1 Tax=Enterobacter chuandaensis TaxID=2497875 RepID=A0AA96M4F2_9ENTR|nr:type II secretion system protein M [Enterobacter chuandaensis]MCW4781528.1 type II secretion system protein M [Enterobacter chuandaensis]MDA4759380.1 type II secretion system protein M [Enterobacter chuandaensis]OQD51032.1 general secretion pathway protein GspM [Enterobacter cancerogenus]WNS39409.1 type II secretion system protein M [Enterobacter chuandaensis]
MKERITQLKSRYQNYSAREKVILKICAAALLGAVVYYAGMIPLDNMIQNSKATLTRQKETLNWMRSEIDKNHLQVQMVKTDNPRTVVENSAQEIHLPLTDVRQDGQTLSFVVNRVNVYELKNWLREINQTSGVRLQKMNLTPVDHLSDVKAEVQLTWSKTA